MLPKRFAQSQTWTGFLPRSGGARQPRRRLRRGAAPARDPGGRLRQRSRQPRSPLPDRCQRRAARRPPLCGPDAGRRRRPADSRARTHLGDGRFAELRLPVAAGFPLSGWHGGHGRRRQGDVRRGARPRTRVAKACSTRHAVRDRGAGPDHRRDAPHGTLRAIARRDRARHPARGAGAGGGRRDDRGGARAAPLGRTGRPPREQWACASTPQPRHDPRRARRLLDLAGYRALRPDTPRFRLVYKTSAQPVRRRLAEAVQAELGAVGIAVDVRVYEWGTLYADVRSGNFELASLAWVGVTDPDLYYLAFHSTMMPPAGYNRGAYVSRVTDRLTKAGRQTFEPARRRAIYARVP